MKNMETLHLLGNVLGLTYHIQIRDGQEYRLLIERYIYKCVYVTTESIQKGDMKINMLTKTALVQYNI